MAVFLSHSEEETFQWAKGYGAALKGGDVVLLDGEMGAGQTVVAKGIAAGMGIPDEVTSPTYAYINSYQNRLFHFDCYRVPSEAYAESLGFAEYCEMGGVCLIEWSERIAGLLPPNAKRVKIEKKGESVREITF